MKKLVICNLTMQEDLKPINYISNDKSIPSSIGPVLYPINSFLASTLDKTDDVRVLLIAKEDPEGRYLKCRTQYEEEFNKLCASKCNSFTYSIITTPFDEEFETHNQLLDDIIKNFNVDDYIVSDVTYGSKDLPILLFAALSFAMQHMNCCVEYVLYRQVFFRNSIPTDPKICNLAQLLHLTSLMYTIKCENPEKAVKMIDALLKQ